MDPVHTVAIPDSQKKFISQLAHDFRAALSYVSFYPITSSFVTQAIHKLHKDFHRILGSINPLYLHVQEDKLYVNDYPLSALDDLLQLFKNQNLHGVEITKDMSISELTAWLQVITFPFEETVEAFRHAHKKNIRPMNASQRPPTSNAVAEALRAAEAATPSNGRDSLDKNNKAFLSFVAEAWQFSQLQRKTLGNTPETFQLLETFDQLFNRLLDRMEKSSPEFQNISSWFKNPAGEFMMEGTTSSMYSLLEVAIENGWPSVLFDPATEGLVSECMNYWVAQGRQDLVEKTVNALAQGLRGNPLERQLALTHLMDARPWVKNAKLVEKVLDQLNYLIASEVFPGTYQSALLLAWDLVEAALDLERQQPVLTLLATLHFQADDDVSSFPECSSIARHWLYERSTPELIRRLVDCAYQAGKLNHFPLLGEMASPLLLEDFFVATGPQKEETLKKLYEIREAVRSALVEFLAGVEDEERVFAVLPILERCGLDGPLALQLSSWITKGSPFLKHDLIDLVDRIGQPVGGLALRAALLDESENVAIKAAQVFGKIKATGGGSMLLKAVQVRDERFGSQPHWLAAVCLALGELSDKDNLLFVQQVAQKSSTQNGQPYAPEVRLAAMEALAKIDHPDSWKCLQSIRKEENPLLKEAVDRLLKEKETPQNKRS